MARHYGEEGRCLQDDGPTGQLPPQVRANSWGALYAGGRGRLRPAGEWSRCLFHRVRLRRVSGREQQTEQSEGERMTALGGLRGLDRAEGCHRLPECHRRLHIDNL